MVPKLRGQKPKENLNVFFFILKPYCVLSFVSSPYALALMSEIEHLEKLKLIYLPQLIM